MVGIIAVLITSIILSAIFVPKIENRVKEDTQTLLKNEQLIKESLELSEKLKNLSQQSHDYGVSTQQMIDHFDELSQILSKQYQNHEKECKENYIQLQKDCTENYIQAIQEKTEIVQQLDDEINSKRNIISAIVEQNKREEEKRIRQDFYRLNLSDNDIDEISKIRSIIPYIRNAEPLNKIIWKCYYENPYTDLIGRVIGNSTITGIYKITNLTNQMCYVGQAVNIADRWKQHIKKGIGADTPTKNKLYPAMQKYGVENFSFEVIEECPRELLNEREDFWQDYYKAKEFGYSIK